MLPPFWKRCREGAESEQLYSKTQQINLLQASGHLKLLHYIVVSERMIMKTFLQYSHCGGPPDYT